MSLQNKQIKQKDPNFSSTLKNKGDDEIIFEIEISDNCAIDNIENKSNKNSYDVSIYTTPMQFPSLNKLASPVASPSITIIIFINPTRFFLSFPFFFCSFK